MVFTICFIVKNLKSPAGGVVGLQLPFKDFEII